MQPANSRIRRRSAPRRIAADGLLSISQLALAADETVHAVRYYARIGLIEPVVVGVNGYRSFDQGTLARLHFIRRAQRLGFTLDEIGGFIHDARRGSAPCPHVREILDRRLPRIGEQLAEMGALHERMTRASKLWRRRPDSPPSGDEICRLIESTTPGRFVSERQLRFDQGYNP